MQLDHFDVVRQFYRALNSGDVHAATEFYAEDCLAENILPAAEGHGLFKGRDEVRRQLNAFLAECEGGFEDGSLGGRPGGGPGCSDWGGR